MATREKQIEELRKDLFYVDNIVIDEDEKANVLYDLGVRKVVLCDNCYLQGSCIVEDTFNTARMADSMKFCAVGKSKNKQAPQKLNHDSLCKTETFKVGDVK